MQEAKDKKNYFKCFPSRSVALNFGELSTKIIPLSIPHRGILKVRKIT